MHAKSRRAPPSGLRVARDLGSLVNSAARRQPCCLARAWMFVERGEKASRASLTSRWKLFLAWLWSASGAWQALKPCLRGREAQGV